jgi:hypothetical protein
MSGIGSGSYPMAGLVIGCAKPTISATIALVNCLKRLPRSNLISESLLLVMDLYF